MDTVSQILPLVAFASRAVPDWEASYIQGRGGACGPLAITPLVRSSVQAAGADCDSATLAWLEPQQHPVGKQSSVAYICGGPGFQRRPGLYAEVSKPADLVFF